MQSCIIGPLLSNYTRDIDQTLDKKQGLAIVIGMSAVDGGKVDAKNMEEAFQELNFAVIKLLDVDINQLHAIIKAAASKLQAPSSIKATAVYFAGHGGSNSDKPFVVTKESAKMTVQDIVSPFYPVSAPHGKHLFFFDICLGLKVDPGVRDESSSTRDMPKLNLIPSHGNTLVAFANSIGFKVRGDQKEGGYWTRFLRKNIVKDQDIYMVLADTWTQTVQFTSKTGDQGVQGPSINACMGRFNLRRKLTCTLKSIQSYLVFNPLFTCMQLHTCIFIVLFNFMQILNNQVIEQRLRKSVPHLRILTNMHCPIHPT